MTQPQTALATINKLNLPDLPSVKNLADLKTALQKFSSDTFNVLVPAAMNFGDPFLKVAFELVVINPEVDNYYNGPDIYSVDKGKTYTFHARAANRIADAAGLIWTSSQTTRSDVDETGRVLRVEYAVGWKIKKPNGSVREGVSTGYYNYDEDKVRFPSNDGRQAESRRHFAVQLAESNAKLRAVFDALGQLQRSFKLDEIRKPFIVPCVVEDLTDLIKGDPEARRMFLAHRLGLKEAIFGPSQSPGALPASFETLPDEPQQQPKTVASPAAAPAAKPVDKKQEYIDAMKALRPEERKAELDRLLVVKAQAWPDDISWEKLTLERQIEGLWYYSQMADSKKAPWENGGKPQ